MSLSGLGKDCTREYFTSMALRCTATALSGAFFGGSWFMSAADAPSWKDVVGGPSAALESYIALFPHAKKLQSRIAIWSGLAGMGCYYFCKPADKRMLIGGLLMWSLGPWTYLMIQPVNRQLLDTQKSRKMDDKWKADRLDDWTKGHLGRTLISGAAFLTFLWVAWEKH